jgi:predicted Zn-dependent protease
VWLCVIAGLPAAAHGPLHEQIAELTARIERDPRDAFLYLRRGELRALHGDGDAALADLDRAARLAPALAAVDLARGKALLGVGRLAPAREALDRFLSREPDHPEGTLTRARVLVALGDNRAAALDYGRAIAKRDRPEPEHYVEWARALAGLGDPGRAVHALDEGMAKLGPIVSLQVPAIDLDLAAGRIEAALARVDALASSLPRPEPWLARRGEILERAGRAEEARRAYEAALAGLRLARTTRTTEELESRLRAALARLGAGPVKGDEP